MKRPLLALALVFVIAAAAGLIAGEAAPPPGELTFKAHNAAYKADGRFASWRFTKVDIPGGDLTKGAITIEVDLASVTEASAKLAEHLRTADFFDVAKFQTATIAISGAKPAGEKRYTATASVDLHGVKGTCPVSFEVVSEKPLKIKGEATLDRSVFGIGEPHDAANKYSPSNDVAITLSAKLQD